MTQKNIAIIGAGISGLACARALSIAGHTVTVFDKGRGIGGRMATRRVDLAQGVVTFDHGAQYFTARDPEFAAALEAMAPAREVWKGEHVALTLRAPTPCGAEAFFVGAPGMNAVPKALATGLNVQTSRRVDSIAGSPGAWRLQFEGGDEAGPFSEIVVAVPAEQATGLLAPISTELANEAAQAQTAPCWAAMFAFDQPTPSPFDSVRFRDHEILGWAACDSSKPGRAQNIVAWVAHANSTWTKAHLEEPADDIASTLLAALGDVMEADVAPIYSQAHRWRYAQVTTPVGTPFGWDAARGIGTCGDWRLGPRVELAWQSGNALGRALS
jgi:renalase